MIFKGEFYVNKKKCAGECEIDDNNQIYLTIYNNSDTDVKKITGLANNHYLSIYEPRLVDYSRDYVKFRSSYLVASQFNLKIKNVDFTNYIRDFKFTFEPLDEWLEFKTIEVENDSINFNIPEDILIYDKKNINIKISFIKEDFFLYDNKIKNIKVRPYICISSKEDMNIDNIRELIQLITRFFAILMGFSGKVEKIYFHKNYKEKIKLKRFEDYLIINTDLSNKYTILNGYPTHNLRTYYNQFKKSLNSMFDKWYDIYLNSRYKESIIYYFNPYVSNTIEDEFLIMTKCLEKISLAGENIEEKRIKNDELHSIIVDFYKEHKKELETKLKNKKYDKGYIKNIDKIHEEIADSIVHSYNRRIKLSDRIKFIDDKSYLAKMFKNVHVKNLKDNYNVYDYIAETRNYYTHLDKDEFIIKNDYIHLYNRKLEKLLVFQILSLLISDKKIIDEIIKKDRYLNLYDYFGY